jgi:hypothetical protein
MRLAAWLSLFCLSLNPCFAQIYLNNVPAAFSNISSKPHEFHFINHFKIPLGGHLQGIQGYGSGSCERIVLSGSSGKASYYITASIDTPHAKTQTFQKLLDSPFRHAGGCQVVGGKLFVGVEDNIAKDKSSILMINLSDNHVNTIIIRKGQYKRSTAGAVGSVKRKDGKYLLVVGDWDSENLDFYPSQDTSANTFDSIFAYHKPSNESWCSYQSLNLLSDTSGNIFLIGFGKEANRNRADLFQLNKYIPKLLLTRYFNCTKGSSFRFAAGLRTVSGNKLLIFSSSRQLKRNNTINIFGL